MASVNSLGVGSAQIRMEFTPDSAAPQDELFGTNKLIATHAAVATRPPSTNLLFECKEKPQLYPSCLSCPYFGPCKRSLIVRSRLNTVPDYWWGTPRRGRFGWVLRNAAAQRLRNASAKCFSPSRRDCLLHADNSGRPRQFNRHWWTALVSISAEEATGELVR
jgi:hypothetical protein